MKNRHDKILEVLTKNQRVEVAALADMLEVSQVTVRKDLDRLEERGLIRRRHGFASLESADDVAMRLAYHYNTKRRIAAAAAAEVADGETVMIESGSCCALLAEELANTKRDITIVTNSAFIASHIRHAQSAKTILLGGYYQKNTQVTVGPITKACAEMFFADTFFIGADGFSKEFGFTGKDHSRAQTVQDLAGTVARVAVLTESKKFSRQGVVRLLRTERVAALYTDDRIPPDIAAFLRNRNVVVHTVGASE
ncbi:MAG: DeoR/GlpR family DNA-binding transcription regulator [Spirochaetaceae bacterium]|jgi:DeoR/GlpR family transcriptional regulator of sugar metabolism|nr:DeoR/GlpR family DNA-binding transcription regulator [Spirochaetaceae bacterium]